MSFSAPENDTQTTKEVSRRTLVKGAAWAVPVIAFAAPVPAMAASPCTPSTNFDGLTPGNTVQTSIVFYNSLNQPTGVTASIAYASNGQGGDSTPGGTGTVAATSTNPSWNYIEIEMLSELNAGDSVTLTLTLSQAVTGLSFTIHDIDKVRNGQNQVAWEDFVEIGGTFSGSPVAYISALGNNVTGAGTAASPFQPIAWGDNPIDSGLNRVTVTFNAPGEPVRHQISCRPERLLGQPAHRTRQHQLQHLSAGDGAEQAGAVSIGAPRDRTSSPASGDRRLRRRGWRR